MNTSAFVDIHVTTIQLNLFILYKFDTAFVSACYCETVGLSLNKDWTWAINRIVQIQTRK